MIAACYDLQLYCDNPGCEHGRFRERGHAEYTDELGSKCRAAARRNGWWIARPDAARVRRAPAPARGRPSPLDLTA